LREINERLTEGLECKDLIKSKNEEIRKLDSTFSIIEKINVNLNKEISAAEKKEAAYKSDIIKSDSTMNKAVTENIKLNSKLTHQTNNKKTWRGIALGEAGFIALVVALVILL